MYKNVSIDEYKKYLGLDSDYRVDGLLLHGTWNIEHEADLLNEALVGLNIEYSFNKIKESDF